jgi:hypothetical protein
MQLTCTVCGTSHDYRAVTELPIPCNTCHKSFTPRGDSFDRAVASYELWKNSQPAPRHEPEAPVRTARGTGQAPPIDPEVARSRAQTEPGHIRTPRARTVRPEVRGHTRERIQYLALDKMEIEAIERIQAMVNTNRDYPDRNRDILLIGIAERLERIENMLLAITLPKDQE